MKKEILNIEGMSCVNCEKTITKELKNLGVTKLNVSYLKSNVELEYDETKLELNDIINAIEKHSYTVKQNKKGLNKNLILVFIGIIILSLYLIIQNTVGFNFIPEVTQSMGYGMLFIIGILTSLHCVAMCGGINLSQSISVVSISTKVSKYEKIKPSLYYNLGRLLSYTLIGGIVGGLGQVISISGTFKGAISILAGLFMIIMGLNMLNVFPKLRKLNITMPSFIRQKLVSSKKNNTPFYVGFLNGLMPCGPLQTMQLYALGTGSVLVGALSMFFFALGTIPLMFILGAASTIISRDFNKKMMLFGSILVIILGVVMFNRGLALYGVNINVVENTEIENMAMIQEDKQIVKSKIESGSYPTITVQKGLPVEWVINVSEGDLNGCNNPITLPSFKIEKELEYGKNIINFTPTESGSYIYTCWMGMITGNIIVVDSLN